MLTYGLLGRDQRSASAPASASSTPGAGAASPSKRTASTSSRWPRATNHSWKANAARRRVDPGAQPVVGRRAGSPSRPRAPREADRDRRERLAGAQRLRAHEVETEIAVAERGTSPRRRARQRCRARSTSRRPGPSRAPRRAGRRARRGCCRGRERRRGRGPRGRRRRCRSRSRRPDRSRSTRPHAKRAPPTPPERSDDFHVVAIWPSAACVRGPARRPIRCRSSIVSTSSRRFGITPRRPSHPAR